MCSILNLISEKFTPIQESKSLWTTQEHDSLKIWTKTNTFCWFSQKIKGGPTEWITQVLKDNPDNYEIKSLNSELILEESRNYYPYEQIHGNHYYHPYIKKRGISQATFDKYQLEVLDNNILIPILNKKGKRVGCQLRTLEENAKFRYELRLNSNDNVLWPMQYYNKIKDNDVVLIFEGCFSAMRFDQVLGNKVKCFSTFGSNPSFRLRDFLNRLTNVWFVLDNDEGGIKYKKQIDYINPYWKYDIPIKYPDEMTAQEIKIYAREVFGIE